MVRKLREEVQDIEDKRYIIAVRKYFAEAQLEGKKPTKYFCSLNKKRMEKAWFEELHVVEKKPNGEEQIRVLNEQKEVEGEVRKLYWHLYKEEERNINTREVLEN